MIEPAAGPLVDLRWSGAASWIEVNAEALRHNVAELRRLLADGQRLGAVLKANAYGHGLDQVLPVVHGLVETIDVITPQDALRVREYERRGQPRRQVLVIGATTVDELVELAREEVDVVIADAGWPAVVDALRTARLGHPARAHIHLDTGLGREGFTSAELPDLCARLVAARDVIEVTGVLSHFANTEDVTEQGYALAQLDAFESGYRYLQSALQLPATTQRHFAASAAAMVLPQARYDVIRAGISLYGLWPSSETRLSARYVLKELPRLQPVLTWKCRSQAVKRLPAGAYVGYGCTYRCAQETTVAVLPVGYFDGYPRMLSSRGHVLVNGARCPVLGRVMMNHIVVDVSRASAGDGPATATLIGTDGAEHVSADHLAEWAGTINYEIVARLGGHLRRVVI
jgi:alanine racemase